MKVRTIHNTTIQLAIAVALVIVGCGLLIAGFVVSPTGEIHNSVLIAFGEIMTFTGALLGVDYHYRAGAAARNTLEEDVRSKEVKGNE